MFQVTIQTLYILLSYFLALQLLDIVYGLETKVRMFWGLGLPEFSPRCPFARHV
mgnify:CR=1 FL=1